jgi:hypothetical protein
MDSAPRVALHRALLDRINKIAPSNALHALLFSTLSIVVLVMLYRAPIGPGQDYHYHVMSAAMNARPSSDPLRGLYHSLHPFDANTLVYRVAWPFIKLFGPVRGFQCAVALLYYLGFPAATWYALRRSGRAPWGSLLAFAAMFSRGWAVDGFIPFLTSAPFMIVMLAEWDVLFASRDARPRRLMITGAVTACLLFLAHGHTYAWTAVVLGLFTAFAAVRELLLEDERPLRTRALDAAKMAGRSLAMIAPSLVLLATWYRRVETYAPPVPTPPGGEWRYAGINLVLRNALQAIDQYFTPLVDLQDLRFVAAFAMIIALLLFVVRRDNRSSQFFEWFALLSFAVYLVGPADIRGQSIAPRHMEFFIWTLPLIVWRAKDPTLREPSENTRLSKAIEASLLALVMVFSVMRIKAIEKALVGLNQVELGPMLALEAPCRRIRRTPYSLLAYVPMNTASNYVQSVSMHQAHETLAALCGVETPVYDSRLRPHHLLPLRYRQAMPAPVGIFHGVGYWFVDVTGILQAYDMVLTYDWTPTAEQQPELDRVAVLVARSGPYRLYRRR